MSLWAVKECPVPLLEIRSTFPVFVTLIISLVMWKLQQCGEIVKNKMVIGGKQKVVVGCFVG